jgi:hypothetical protein
VNNTDEDQPPSGDQYFVNVEGWEYSRNMDAYQGNLNKIQTVEELSD